MKKHALLNTCALIICFVCLALFVSGCNDDAASTPKDDLAEGTQTPIDEPTVPSEKPTEEITEATQDPTNSPEDPTEEPKYEPNYPEWIFADIPELDESKFDPENPSEKYAIVLEGTEELPDNAFYKHNKLLGVKLPSTLKKIGSRAFSGCTSLKKVIIPEGVTEIESGAFWECSNLETLYLPSTLTTLGDDIFDACDSLRQVVIPEGVTVLSVSLFFNCKYLNSIALPSSIEKIDKSCFAYCVRLKNIYFLGTVEQWNNIEKIDGWNEGTKSPITVTCSDGIVEY